MAKTNEYLKKLTIRKKVRYLSPKDENIRPETRTDIRKYLLACGIRVVFPKDWDWEFTTRNGVFTKRLSRLIYKTQKISLPPTHLAYIGMMAREGSMGKPKEYIFDVTDTFNWKKGAFKDSSCFWATTQGKKPPARGTRELNALKRSGALALRFFPKISFRDRGLGRSWVFEDGPYIYLFNTYGIPGYTQAGVLAGYLGLSYKRVQGRSPLYLNHGIIYMIGTEEDLDKIKNPTHWYSYGSDGRVVDKRVRLRLSVR